MAIKSASGIYQVLEDILRQTDKPLTCVDLYEMESVKRFVQDANKVSDFLGHMWRRELLQRWVAPPNSRARARYAYTWRTNDDADDKPLPVPGPPRLVAGTDVKPNVVIREGNGEVVLDFPQFTITVRSK